MAAAAVFAGTQLIGSPSEPGNPWTYQADEWVQAWSAEGDSGTGAYETLNAATPGLDQADAQAARAAAVQALTYDLTGNADVPVDYATPLGTLVTSPRCDGKVRVLASSPAALPTATGTWAKVLLAYSGKCDGVDSSPRNPAVTYGYVEKVDSRWMPRRPWDVPAAVSKPAPALVDMAGCGTNGQTFQARAMVAAAFENLCRDAQKAGVLLRVTDAHRTREQQAELFARAVEETGSVQAAERAVEYADDKVCRSRFCSGTLIGLEPTPRALEWLSAADECLTATGRVPAAQGKCAADQLPVPRTVRYGFLLSGSLLEYALPPDVSGVPADCAPYGEQVPAVIAAVFRCRLGQAGIVGPPADQVVREALTVSRCASGWNPQAAVFDGAYASTPLPQTGFTYPHRGLFGLDPVLATGGWAPADWSDPVSAADAAARLWIAHRSFAAFPCATGALPGLDAGPVLPQFGGVPLPAWSESW